MILLDLPYSHQYFEFIFTQFSASPSIEYITTSPQTVRTMVVNGLSYSIMNIPTGTNIALDGKKYH